MSIYATVWQLQFPTDGDDPDVGGWIEVWAQGVPSHIGSPTPGSGYEDGDPYAAFLPPPIADDPDGCQYRAVVFVKDGTPKGTARSHQEYVEPLLIMTGESYFAMPFNTLYNKLCDALRGGGSPMIAKLIDPDRTVVIYADGTERSLDRG